MADTAYGEHAYTHNRDTGRCAECGLTHDDGRAEHLPLTDLGWLFPTRSAQRAHYFRQDRRSLCGKYGALGFSPDQFDPEKGGEGASDDDCVACRKKLENQGVR